MATTMNGSMMSDIVQNFQTLINDPKIFHEQNADEYENFKKISKKFYDRIVPCIISNSKSKFLKSLLINEFDDEQVWQQLEIQNKNTVQHLGSWLSQIASDDTLIDVDNKRSVVNHDEDHMFNDFFDGRDSGDENVMQPDETSDVESEELDFDDTNIPPEEGDSEGGDDDESTLENKSKPPFQIEQEKIKNQISEYEESMVTPKPWQLTGEVDVNKRPVDGLLDLQIDFELNAKPIIIQDKELCEKLESMIKMTIKNKAYSDGVRQEKPVKEIINMKKEIVIDQNKSKKGLAQEYEEMYLKKQSKQEGENPKHQEIKKFMDSLFPELYALFSHIPKPAVPDIKIVSNLPAVTVEEVAPTSYSDVTLLAPEEIKEKKAKRRRM